MPHYPRDGRGYVEKWQRHLQHDFRSARGGYFSNPQQQLVSVKDGYFSEPKSPNGEFPPVDPNVARRCWVGGSFGGQEGGTARFAGSHCRDQLSNIIGKSFIFYFALCAAKFWFCSFARHKFGSHLLLARRS